MRTNRISWAVAATVLTLPILTACTHQPPGAGAGAAPPATAPCLDAHHGLDATLWMQNSAEFRAATRQTFQTAALRLEQALGDPQWTAALEQDAASMAGLPPAIIVDVDETILDNTPFQARMIIEGLTFEAAAWDRWVRQAEAAALNGAQEFLHHADSLGVTVFYVTNRGAAHEPATRRNLEREQMAIT